MFSKIILQKTDNRDDADGQKQPVSVNLVLTEIMSGVIRKQLNQSPPFTKGEALKSGSRMTSWCTTRIYLSSSALATTYRTYISTGLISPYAIAFPVVQVDQLLFAPPEYLEQRGAQQTLDDLKDHNCLLYRLGKKVFDQWKLAGDHSQYRI